MTQTQLTITEVIDHADKHTPEDVAFLCWGAECRVCGPLMNGDWFDHDTALRAALEHEEAHPMDVKLTGYDDSDGAYSSEVFTLDVNGAGWKMEVWHTDSADGTEFYSLADGEWAGLPEVPEEQEDDLSERIDALQEAFSERYHALYIEHVQPILARITAEAVEAANAAVTQTQEAE